MDTIGVIDLLDGRAVHARGGHRDRYQPVAQVGSTAIAPGDALALARVYVDHLGVDALYVADLNAILGRGRQDALIARLTAPGTPVWLDGAIASPDAATHARRLGAAQVIVGLETLPAWPVFAAICEAVGRAHVAFSLDLRDGHPLVAHPRVLEDTHDAAALAARAADAGAGSIVVLDLARVGSGLGPDIPLIARIRPYVPHVRLLAGGGVRHRADLSRLSAAGCDGALVATALHTGQLGAADVRAVRSNATIER